MAGADYRVLGVFSLNRPGCKRDLRIRMDPGFGDCLTGPGGLDVDPEAVYLQLNSLHYQACAPVGS